MRIIARTDTKAVHFFITPGRRQSKTLILSTNVDQKSIETEFSIAIGNRKTPFLAIFIHVRRLLRTFSIAAYTVHFVSHYEKTTPAKRTIAANCRYPASGFTNSLLF